MHPGSAQDVVLSLFFAAKLPPCAPLFPGEDGFLIFFLRARFGSHDALLLRPAVWAASSRHCREEKVEKR
jgi:hypothetical protein